MEAKEVCELIENNKNELFELLCQLIRINSENFETHGNEKACAEYINQLCLEWGFDSDMYSPLEINNFSEHPDYLPGRGLENRYNVTVRWPGKENRDELMLMGHTDTVVIGDPANWTVDPLAGVIKDGKVWGRGASDDKYALAASIFLMRLLKNNGFVPKANMLFTAYCDEERGGSHGALAAVMRYPSKYIVNMDSDDFILWHCASGGQEARYCYRTENTVDSAKITAEAIPVVMEVLNEFALKRRTELEKNPFYMGTAIPESSFRYMGFRAGNRGADLGIGEIDFVFYTDKSKSHIYEEYREIEKILAERLAPLGIIGEGIVPTTRFFHYAYSNPDCEAIKEMQRAAFEATGRDLVPCGSCLSDMSVILKYGSNEAFSFGAGRGFEKQGGAHQPDEFIGCDDLLEFTKIMAVYILNVLG